MYLSLVIVFFGYYCFFYLGTIYLVHWLKSVGNSDCTYWFICADVSRVVSLLSLTGCQGPEGTTSTDCPGPIPSDLPPPCAWPRIPCHTPRDINPCPRDATVGLVSSSLQPNAAWPQVPPRQVHPWANVIFPTEVLVPRARPALDFL